MNPINRGTLGKLGDRWVAQVVFQKGMIQSTWAMPFTMVMEVAITDRCKF